MIAPTATRFAIGTGLGDPTPLGCVASVATDGRPATYRVVCPPAPTGSQLLATISYGAFDYGFAKTL